jgi:hypothetical protein
MFTVNGLFSKYIQYNICTCVSKCTSKVFYKYLSKSGHAYYMGYIYGTNIATGTVVA